MHHSSFAKMGIGGLLLWLGTPDDANAQAPFTFEFRPSGQLSLHKIVESQGRLFFVGFPELPDSTTAEVSSRASITRRTAALETGGYAVRVSYDSVTAQSRISEDVRDLPLPWDGGLWADYVADRRMVFTGPTGSNDSAAVSIVRAAAASPHLVLPQGGLVPGDEWSSEISMPFAMELPSDSPVIIAVDLSATVAGRLDSLLARGADTLAFISLRGNYSPTTLDTDYQLGGGPARVEFWGNFAGSMIWSTGWNAFVSGVVSARINQRLEAVPGSGVEDARVFATVTTRIRVRP